MIKPPVPENEAERLQALHRYRLLDGEREQAFDDLVMIATTLCGTAMGAVTLIESETQWLKAAVGLDADHTTRDSSFCGHAILQPQGLMVVEDARQDERFHDNPLVTGEPHIRFYAGAPLLSSDGYALGTLCVFDPQPRELTPRQSGALLALSRQVSRMMEMRQLARRIDFHQREHEWYENQLADYYARLEAQNADLAEQTRTDPLTGLPNRRAFTAALATAVEQGERNGQPVSVAMIDIDHFKQVNDFHGHDVGDQVLVELAALLRASAAGCGMIARFGGEEFVMLLPDRNLDQARLHCELLREQVKLLPLNLPVTVSIGVAQLQRGEAAEHGIRRADQALYLAKRGGRDEVAVSETTDVSFFDVARL